MSLFVCGTLCECDFDCEEDCCEGYDEFGADVESCRVPGCCD